MRDPPKQVARQSHILTEDESRCRKNVPEDLDQPVVVVKRHSDKASAIRTERKKIDHHRSRRENVVLTQAYSLGSAGRARREQDQLDVFRLSGTRDWQRWKKIISEKIKTEVMARERVLLLDNQRGALFEYVLMCFI